MKLPNKSHRTVILGRTGAGKTVGAVWLLSKQDFSIPWLILDIKGDPLIKELIKAVNAPLLSLDSPLPTKGGIYHVKPSIRDDKAAIDDFFLNIYEQENIGLFIDEGYFINPNSKAFNALLTQGRSKSIPIIMLFQRPRYMSKFAVAQADYFMIYEQNIQEDLKTTFEFCPLSIIVDGEKINAKSRLDKHHFLFYSVSDNELGYFSPCPKPKDLIGRFKNIFKKQKPKKEYV